MRTLKRLAPATALAALLGAGPATADNVTYQVNDPVGAGSIVGDITTDGKQGVLASGDIVDWTLALNGNGATFNLTKADSQLVLQGSDLTATPTQLLFNFSVGDGGMVLFQASNPGVFTGFHYVCFNTTNPACNPGTSIVPAKNTDSSAIYVAESGNQVIGVAQSPSANADLPASLQALARSRTSQMLLAQLQSQLLLGLNEQVSCGNCGGVGAGFGSFALSGHGRYAINKEWTLMGGVDVGQYEEKGADVTLNAGFAAALQYDPDTGPSRPYLEAGVAAGLQNARYTRSYAIGAALMKGVGRARDYDVSLYGEAGWVDRISPRDEAAVYLDYSHAWQMVGGYAEGAGVDNPLAAVVPGGTDTMDQAGVHGQYTRLLNRRVEIGLNGGLDWAFHATSGLKAGFVGGGQIAGAQPQFVSYEVGGRLGIRMSHKLTLDLFVNGELAPRDIGSSVHGGFGMRWNF